MNRRRLLQSLALFAGLPRLAAAAPPAADVGAPTRIGAAWRGPKPSDPYFAGILEADWGAGRLTIRSATPLPTRPHGVSADADGGLLVIGVRPGVWLMRTDGEGRVIRQANLDGGPTRLGGHAIALGEHLFCSETDVASGRGRIGVRHRHTLAKEDEWDTHGIDPHQLVSDGRGCLLLANGGISRSIPGDRKLDLERMDSSLVRLDAGNGRLLAQWRLDDRRLSLRHLAWNHDPARGDALLGIALQAEHDDPAARAAAPLLAILDGNALTTPARDNDGVGYAGDIAAAANGGFAVSSHQAGLALAWQPQAPERLTPVVKFKESYALAPWQGSEQHGGLLVSTAYGLIRWLPAGEALFLAWPEPMALDNHWSVLA